MDDLSQLSITLQLKTEKNSNSHSINLETQTPIISNSYTNKVNQKSLFQFAFTNYTT